MPEHGMFMPKTWATPEKQAERGVVSAGNARRGLSLKLRLGLAAALLGLGAIASAAILYTGMAEVARRLDTALAAEARMNRYATLSTQVSTFLVIATEAVQTGLPTDERVARVEPVVGHVRSAFGHLRGAVEQAVTAARAQGLDEQSRFATQSLGLARMEALLDSALAGLATETDDRARLRAHLDTFASNFDPLLNQAVNTEVLFRNQTLAGIDDLRETLRQTALVIAVAAILLVLLIYFGLIRPQFARLDRLRAAARQIGQEDFALSLPADNGDEIGRLYAETNRMAQALATRSSEVQAEWTKLNATIEDRTSALRDANARLEEIDANRRNFFADVSHELRTPLTVILMEAQIGRQGSADAQASFATIESRAARLNRRIDDLLRVARSDSGQLSLEAQSVNLADIASEAAEEVAAEIANAGMVLDMAEMPEQQVICDPNWARQIVAGLIRNAIRHAREGERVRLSADPGSDTAGLAVTDNGPGVAVADQPRIFERFEQAGAEKAQGFGVGLALARWVAEEQGGSIALQSPLPRAEALGDAPGTKVTVRLPRAEA